MIPIIGLIVSVYTIVRMIDISMRESSGVFVRVLCVLGVVATAFLAFALVSSGASAPRSPF